MKIGFVGLGKMGTQCVRKLIQDGHEVIVYDVQYSRVEDAMDFGATPASNREDLVLQLGYEPVIWFMIPAEMVGAEITAYSDLVPPGSTLIDGGNSNFRETMRRAEALASRHVRYLDVGLSGGVFGLDNGFSMTIGGEASSIAAIQPFFNSLAKPNGAWMHTGVSGSGHYVKMVHNAIEYGIMQAYAEGYDLLKYGEMHEGLDIPAVAETWQRGSIIESRLNRLAAELLRENLEMEGISGYVADSGEGRWALEAAEISRVGMPVLHEAIRMRQASQDGYKSFVTKFLAGLRHKFGGHDINGGQ